METALPQAQLPLMQINFHLQSSGASKVKILRSLKILTDFLEY